MDKTQFESLDQMADATAAAFSRAAASTAFQLFKDERFRKLADFDRLSQTEQDRIFNELVVANLVLIMLTFEAPDLRLANDYREYLVEVKKRIPQAYVQNLKDLGIEAKYLQDWEKLIDMRYEEYARDRHDVRADDEGHGKVDYHLQKKTGGSTYHGGVEVFEGVGMRRGGMIGYRNHQVVIEWTALYLAPN